MCKIAPGANEPRLIIVPTPIGNLRDISERAISALKNCDMVLCEDTRVCAKLLNSFGIKKKMITYRDDNEIEMVPQILGFIQAGSIVCLTSDSGTPAISDPGFRIVRECRRLGIAVESIPGACAAITTLAASGLPSDGFLFVGFLQNKSSARRNFFSKNANFDYSIIFYESCHRILKFLQEMKDVVGDERVVCVAKEVTKIHETFYIDGVGAVLDSLEASVVKGEYVIILAPQRFKL